MRYEITQHVNISGGCPGPHHELIPPEDLPAKAYFGLPDGAKDWLDISRRRLRYYINRYIDAIRERSQRLVFQFPLDTEDAFLMLGGLGHRAARKEFDYCVRHGHIDPPRSKGRRPRWSKANWIEFAMQLQRMQYWLPGRHNDKKTVWELRHEAEAARIPYDGELLSRIDAASPDELLDLMVETGSQHAREAEPTSAVTSTSSSGIAAGRSTPRPGNCFGN